jgi:hypothetical protein
MVPPYYGLSVLFLGSSWGLPVPTPTQPWLVLRVRLLTATTRLLPDQLHAQSWNFRLRRQPQVLGAGMSTPPSTQRCWPNLGLPTPFWLTARPCSNLEVLTCRHRPPLTPLTPLKSRITLHVTVAAVEERKFQGAPRSEEGPKLAYRAHGRVVTIKNPTPRR